jgi:hypothetical protein
LPAAPRARQAQPDDQTVLLAAIEERLREDLRDDVEGIGGLIASARPVLAGLWDNRKDAEYDRLYNRERKEVVVAAITSNVRRHPFGDSLIVDWKDAGLLFPSVATGILRTGTRGMVDRKLGTMGRGSGCRRQWAPPVPGPVTPPHKCRPPEGLGDPVISRCALVDGGWDV